MSDELAQDEDDAEDYDLEALERHDDGHDGYDDDATIVGDRRAITTLQADDVVFEIGDDDMHDSDDEAPRKTGPSKLSKQSPLPQSGHEYRGLLEEQ